MKLDKETLGGNLHAALRKCCDSPATSAAWNCISGLRAKPWNDYLKHVVEGFKEFNVPDASMSQDEISAEWMRHFKKVSLDWDSHFGSNPKNDFLGYEAMTLHCIFECFDDHDWYGFSSWLPDCEIKND